MREYSKTRGSETTRAAAASHTGPAKSSLRLKRAAPIQKAEDDEAQMKAAAPVQKTETPVSDSGGSGDSSGVPTGVRNKMEQTLNTDLSGVTVHTNSSKAKSVGALAYTQGTDIHVAPGQYNPGTSSGKRLLGHELTHVAQQMAGRVHPTGEVNGMPLNDSPSLEAEADKMGAKAV